MVKSYLLAAFCAVAAVSSTIVRHAEAKIRVGAVVFPEHGHFAPLTAILQACVDRGDDVVVYAPKFFIPKEGQDFGPKALTADEVSASSGSKLPGGTVSYVSLGDYSYEAFDDAFFARLVESHPAETLGEVNAHMEPFMAFMTRSLRKYFDGPDGASAKPDVFLVDYGCNNAAFVADYLGIPAVMSWPMTLTFPFGTNFFVPFMAFGFSVQPSLIERWFNIAVYAIARVTGAKSMDHPNKLRAEMGLPPTDVYDMLDRRPVITPSVFGFEINQPLCPNYFPVGMLLPAMNGTVDQSWGQWLERDCTRLVYINMGSVAVLPERWDGAIRNFTIAMANKGTCVVWKRRSLNESGRIGSEEFVDAGAIERLRVVRQLPFSPRHLLKHPISKVFITHCGDTSVLESIDAMAPMVGIPLFADQPNVCASIKDSRVGTFVEKTALTQDLLMAAVEDVFADEQKIVRRLGYMKKTAEAQGLAPRAAEVMHFIADLGFEGSKALNCQNVDEPWYRLYDVDVMVGISAIMWSVIIFGYYFTKCCLCRCCCGQRRNTASRAKAKEKLE